jgi:hypothetical protein
VIDVAENKPAEGFKLARTSIVTVLNYNTVNEI